MDLTEFLHARLREDVAFARNAFENDWADTKPEWSEIWSGTVDTGDEQISTGDSSLSRHIERWDPKRVLAESDAKRRIIARYEKVAHAYAQMPFPGTPTASAREWLHAVLVDLASPYADHPSYDESWRP